MIKPAYATGSVVFYSVNSAVRGFATVQGNTLSLYEESFGALAILMTEDGVL